MSVPVRFAVPPPEPSLLSATSGTATNLTARTERTSYSIPEDGRAITFETAKPGAKGSDVASSLSLNSQTSLLIEYFETGRGGPNSPAGKPSVRVKVSPSTRKGIKAAVAGQAQGGHITIRDTTAVASPLRQSIDNSRTPSWTHRVSLTSPRAGASVASADRFTLGRDVAIPAAVGAALGAAVSSKSPTRHRLESISRSSSLSHKDVDSVEVVETSRPPVGSAASEEIVTTAAAPVFEKVSKGPLDIEINRQAPAVGTTVVESAIPVVPRATSVEDVETVHTTPAAPIMSKERSLGPAVTETVDESVHNVDEPPLVYEKPRRKTHRVVSSEQLLETLESPGRKRRTKTRERSKTQTRDALEGAVATVLADKYLTSGHRRHRSRSMSQDHSERDYASDDSIAEIKRRNKAKSRKMDDTLSVRSGVSSVSTGSRQYSRSLLEKVEDAVRTVLLQPEFAEVRKTRTKTSRREGQGRGRAMDITSETSETKKHRRRSASLGDVKNPIVVLEPDYDKGRGHGVVISRDSVSSAASGEAAKVKSKEKTRKHRSRVNSGVEQTEEDITTRDGLLAAPGRPRHVRSRSVDSVASSHVGSIGSVNSERMIVEGREKMVPVMPHIPGEFLDTPGAHEGDIVLTRDTQTGAPYPPPTHVDSMPISGQTDSEHEVVDRSATPKQSFKARAEATMASAALADYLDHDDLPPPNLRARSFSASSIDVHSTIDSHRPALLRLPARQLTKSHSIDSFHDSELGDGTGVANLNRNLAQSSRATSILSDASSFRGQRNILGVQHANVPLQEHQSMLSINTMSTDATTRLAGRGKDTTVVVGPTSREIDDYEEESAIMHNSPAPPKANAMDWWFDQNRAATQHHALFDQTPRAQAIEARHMSTMSPNSPEMRHLNKLQAGHEVIRGVGANPSLRSTPVAAASIHPSIHGDLASMRDGNFSTRSLPTTEELHRATPPVRLGASAVPMADDLMPEFDHIRGSDASVISDINTNPSIIQGPIGSNPRVLDTYDEWGQNRVNGAGITPMTPGQKDEGYMSADPRTSAPQMPTGLGLMAAHNDQAFDEEDDGTRTPTIERRGMGELENSPGGGELYARPYAMNRLSAGSGNSHGMPTPLYDPATGRGVDRIQSKDIVALMDHLTVRDAQRNARDTEILVTLVRSAAEMRNSFEDIKRQLDQASKDIVADVELNTQSTVHRAVIQGPRPQPITQRPLKSRQAIEQELNRVEEVSTDPARNRVNVFRRMLKGLSSRSTNDLARIEDLLQTLLTEVEGLKGGPQDFWDPSQQSYSGSSQGQRHSMSAAGQYDQRGLPPSDTPLALEDRHADDSPVRGYPSTIPEEISPNHTPRGSGTNLAYTTANPNPSLRNSGLKVYEERRQPNVSNKIATMEEIEQQQELEQAPVIPIADSKKPRPEAIDPMTPRKESFPTSLENTPRSGETKGKIRRKQRESAPKISRWSESTNSTGIKSFFRGLRNKNQEKADSDGSLSNPEYDYYANEHARRTQDELLEQEPMSPFVDPPVNRHSFGQQSLGQGSVRPPSRESTTAYVKKAKRMSLDIKHPQPRAPNRHQLEQQAETLLSSPESLSPNDPAHPDLGPRGQYGAYNTTATASEMSPLSEGFPSAAAGTSATTMTAPMPGPPRPPKIKDDVSPLTPTGPPRPPKIPNDSTPTSRGLDDENLSRSSTRKRHSRRTPDSSGRRHSSPRHTPDDDRRSSSHRHSSRRDSVDSPSRHHRSSRHGSESGRRRSSKDHLAPIPPPPPTASGEWSVKADGSRSEWEREGNRGSGPDLMNGAAPQRNMSSSNKATKILGPRPLSVNSNKSQPSEDRRERSEGHSRRKSGTRRDRNTSGELHPSTEQQKSSGRRYLEGDKNVSAFTSLKAHREEEEFTDDGKPWWKM